MKSIGIIVFYFGEKPWYHDFFIDSCKRNKSIDFLFFTDNISIQKQDENVKYIPFSIDKFNNLATDKLGFKINVSNGLKICDFRPAFGIIFNDFIKDFDYWGYSDTDIIYGNLRSFLDDDTLTYDYISVRDDYPSGYFSIFKNDNKINLLYSLSKDYKKLFLKEENTLFEECGGAYSEVCNGVNILNSSCNYETFHHVLEKNKDNLKILFELFSIEGNVGEIKVMSDILVFMNKFEIMMYHLTSYKTNLFSIIPSKLIKPVFFINRYAFNKSKFNISFILNYLQRLYLFYISNYISFPLRQNIINTGTYIYMNEKIYVNDNFFKFLDQETAFKIKKIPLSKLYIFGDFVLRKITRTKFELFSSNGNKKTYIESL